MNGHQLRIQMAERIFLECKGDLNKSLQHEKMPYKTKKTLRKLAEEHGWYEQLGVPKFNGNALSKEDIENIHEIFIKTGGHTCKTAELTGFGASTISKYATSLGWREGMLQNEHDEEEVADTEAPPYRDDRDNKEKAMAQLIKLRELLLNEIMENEDSEASGKPTLKIIPKTLSEAVKALIDIDKRISEREGNYPATMMGSYQNILANCAEITED